MLKHAGSTGEINMHITYGLSLRRGMYMSGQIKADVYMKFRFHLRWGIYLRSSVNDQFNGNRSPWLGIGHPVPVIFNGKTFAQEHFFSSCVFIMVVFIMGACAVAQSFTNHAHMFSVHAYLSHDLSWRNTSKSYFVSYIFKG